MGEKKSQENCGKQPNNENLVHHSIGYGKKDIYCQKESPAQALEKPIFGKFLDQMEHSIKLIQFLSSETPFIKKYGVPL
jgi:hypothetical protein